MRRRRGGKRQQPGNSTLRWIKSKRPSTCLRLFDKES